MTTAILALLAALVPLAVWLIKRWAEKKDDPLQQHRERYWKNNRKENHE